jgi:hypothetical protein
MRIVREPEARVRAIVAVGRRILFDTMFCFGAVLSKTDGQQKVLILKYQSTRLECSVCPEGLQKSVFGSIPF